MKQGGIDHIDDHLHIPGEDDVAPPALPDLPR